MINRAISITLPNNDVFRLLPADAPFWATLLGAGQMRDAVTPHDSVLAPVSHGAGGRTVRIGDGTKMPNKDAAALSQNDDPVESAIFVR